MTHNQAVILDLTYVDHRGAFGLWRVANEPLPRYVLEVDEDATLSAAELLSGVAEMFHDNGVDPNAPVAVGSYVVLEPEGHAIVPFQWGPGERD